MGVMSCSRKNCGNIMCDTYINDVGYICRECQEEFIQYLDAKSDSSEDASKTTVKTLKDFMLTSQGTQGVIKNIREFFREHTRE